MTIWTDMLDTPFEIGPVMAGGVRTRSLRAGSGEPVIFLHGVSGHLECFTKTIPEHAKHFSVHAIDLLGAGFTDQLTEPTTIPALSKHVLDYMDALDIESAHLVAISVGGWVAGWTAAEHPDRVKNLTLVIPAGVKPVAARHNLLLQLDHQGGDDRGPRVDARATQLPHGRSSSRDRGIGRHSIPDLSTARVRDVSRELLRCRRSDPARALHRGTPAQC